MSETFRPQARLVRGFMDKRAETLRAERLTFSPRGRWVYAAG